jgi:hypothetical protein
MTGFKIKDVEKYYKLVDNKLMNMVTSDVIYTIDKSRAVIGFIFFTVNNVDYFMIHLYYSYELCTRVVINLTTRQIYTTDSATLYFEKPVDTDEDGNIIFKGKWIIDDFEEHFKVKINQDCSIKLLERINDHEEE